MNVEAMAQAVQQYGTLRERAGLGNARSGMTAETVYNNIVEDLKQLEKQLREYAKLSAAYADLLNTNKDLEAQNAQLYDDSEAWRAAMVKNNATITRLREVEKAAQAALTNLRNIED